MVEVTRNEITLVLRRDTCFDALLSRTGGLDEDFERRSLDYFRYVAAPKSSRFFDSEFWSRRVLQISHSQPAVKHAVLALSSLHQRFEPNDPSRSNEHYTFSLRSYNKAIAHTNLLLSGSGPDTLEVGLVACALFVCYENLVGGYASAQMHLQNGLRICSQSKISSPGLGPTARYLVPDDIVHFFSRLELQAMSFSDSRSPYPYLLSQRRMVKPGPIPRKFSSLAEARYLLFEHLKWMTLRGELLDNAEAAQPQPFNSEVFSYLLDSRAESNLNLVHWNKAFISSFETAIHDSHLSTETRYEYTLLQIYYAIGLLFSDTEHSKQESIYDRHHIHFERVFTLVDSISNTDPASQTAEIKPNHPINFSFDLGIVMPLFFATVKCRDPHLRRRGLAHLRSINCREGVWDSAGAAMVAERLVAIEEEGLEVVQWAEDIREEKRVRDIFVVANLETKEIRLSCRLKPNPDGPVTTREEFIRF